MNSYGFVRSSFLLLEKGDNCITYHNNNRIIGHNVKCLELYLAHSVKKKKISVSYYYCCFYLYVIICKLTIPIICSHCFQINFWVKAL